MSRSKASTARYQEAQRLARVQAEKSTASVIRETIDAMPDNVSLTTTDASHLAITVMGDEIARRGEGYLESLPRWVRNPCPSWFTRKTKNQDGDTIYVRDTERWNKESRAALKAIFRGEYEERTRSDGSLERYIAMPCNAARIVVLIREGNAQAVIESAPQVVKSAAIKKDGIVHDLYIETGVVEDVDRLAHRIVVAAADLNTADRAFRKAESDYLNLMGQTTIRNGKAAGDAERLQRRDSAKAKLDAARTVFVAAWSKRNTIVMEASVVEPVKPVKADETVSA